MSCYKMQSGHRLKSTDNLNDEETEFQRLKNESNEVIHQHDIEFIGPLTGNITE